MTTPPSAKAARSRVDKPGRMDKPEGAYPTSAKKHHASLTEAERTELVRLSKSQRHSERERKRARILLLADEAREGGADRD